MIKTLIAAAVAATAFVSLAAQAESATYNIDPSHTFAYFEATHFGTSTYRGRFDKKEGTVTIDAAAKTGKADITIDASSISTGIAPLDTHLKSKDFFDVANNPTIKFAGDKFEFTGDKVSSVAGTLTFHGQTHPVTLKATRYNCYENPMMKRQVCGGDFETTIQRSQWGMDYGVKGPIADAVKLVVQIEAVKQ